MRQIATFSEASFGRLFRHLFFIALCIISVVYYKERTLHFDPAFFNWMMIMDDSFFFALGRNGAILGQLLPLLLIKLGASVKVVLIAFSFSFALWYYIFFLITEYLTRDKIASWVLVLALCLTFRQTFYYTTAEVYHGMALSIVLWSLLRMSFDLTPVKKYLVYSVLILGTLWLPYFHQINLILWFFLVGLEYFSRGNYRDIRLPVLMLIILGWFVARIKFFTISDYEKGKLLSTDDHIYAIQHFFELPSYLYLEEWALLNLTIPLVFFACCILFVVLRGRYLAGAYITGMFIGFTVLIINTNFRGESMIMYENYYSLFGLFIAASWAVANRGRPIGNIISLILAGLTIYSTVEIVQSVWMYRYRTAYLNRLVNFASQSPHDKYLIDGRNYPFAYATVPWAFATETALNSSLLSKPANSTFYFTPDPLKWGPEKENIPEFISVPWAESWFGLNSVRDKGFIFSDQPYKLANTARQKPFEPEAFTTFSSDFSIIPDYNNIIISNPFKVINVYIVNRSGETLHSLPEGPDQTQIGYRIFQNEVVVAESLMPLEIDIPHDAEFISGVIVHKPIDVSQGYIKFGMFTEGYGWWGVSTPIEIETDPD